MDADSKSEAESPLADDPVRDELRRIYDDVDREIAEIGPKCLLSGNCCRFQEYGHTLFVSGPEFDLLLNEAPAPSRPLDDGETCPWQDLNGRCTARQARPLGCRVYFCEPSYLPLAPAISERFIKRLKEFADRHGLPWNYAPLHRHTRRALESGTLDPNPHPVLFD